MKTNKNIVSTLQIATEENVFSAYRIYNDSNGNPRYVVHFLDLGVKVNDYGKIQGLTKYRAKWFGGGYVFQSYDIEGDVKRAIETVKKHYSL